MTNELRYEKKIMLTHSLKEVELLLRLCPVSLRSIFAPRWINNIYLDTPNCDAYRESVNGDTNRTKMRVRWYGDFHQARAPRLEIKYKRGAVGGKRIYNLREFCLADLPFATLIAYLFRDSDLPGGVRLALSGMRITVLNRYCRKYYQTWDKRVRVTVDYNQHFFRPIHWKPLRLQEHREKEGIVVEVKFEKRWAQYARGIINYLPSCQVKHSKYVKGMESFECL